MSKHIYIIRGTKVTITDDYILEIDASNENGFSSYNLAKVKIASVNIEITELNEYLVIVMFNIFRGLHVGRYAISTEAGELAAAILKATNDAQVSTSN